MPAISTEECHVFEYEIGEIKVGYVAAFGTGKRTRPRLTWVSVGVILSTNTSVSRLRRGFERGNLMIFEAIAPVSSVIFTYKSQI